MDIKATLAAQAYSRATPVLAPGQEKDSTRAGNMMRGFADMLRENEATVATAMRGNADPEALVQALAETQLAVETAVTVRDRVVEAYQEILRMPV